jgi:hypothetical protein
VAGGCRPSLQSELGRWIESRPRFGAFVTAHQDKVRKKLRAADDADSRLDVRAELVVAYRLLGDTRFELAFESYGSQQRGPDLSVTFRVNQRFNLEVTRLRSSDLPVVRLANVVVAKVRQMPAEAPNGLVIVARDLAADEDVLASALRLLKQHTDAKDDAFFARRGLRDARDFHALYLRLGGIFVFDEAAETSTAVFAHNPEARHPLPSEALTATLNALA